MSNMSQLEVLNIWTWTFLDYWSDKKKQFKDEEFSLFSDLLPVVESN